MEPALLELRIPRNSQAKPSPPRHATVLTAEGAQGFSGVGAFTPLAVDANNAVTLGFQLIPTVGSIVVLNFAEVIQLTEDYIPLARWAPSICRRQ